MLTHETPVKLTIMRIPVVGVEPTLQRNTILSRARLPIPPHRHNGDKKNRIHRLELKYGGGNRI